MDSSLPPSDTQTSHDYVAVESSKKKVVFILIGLLIVLVVGVVIWLVRSKVGTGAPGSVEMPAASESASTGAGVYEHDKDGDGMSDGKELELGTSDLEFDTDGDGLSDVIEIGVWKTSPTNVDSDGDGFADGYEVINGFNPAGAGKIE